MKLGAATYSYLWQCDVKEAIKKIAERGVKYIELMPTPPHIWPRDWGKEERMALTKLAEDLGVNVFSLNPTYLDINLISTNPAFREESLRQIEEQIELAKDLGAKILILIPGRLHALIPMPREIAWRVAKESVSRCLESAVKNDIILGIENVPFGLLRTAEDLKNFVTEFETEHVRIVYDVANANMVEIPGEGIKTISNWLELVHLADNDGKRWAHLPVGEGSIDFTSVLATLKAVGYEGIYMTELIKPEDPDHDLAVCIERISTWETSLLL
ncbi:MAG: hypothetical protein PWP65_1177 [Clostridia bacterium]|nr:hypothetical protein [Clostridia bacterium]